MADDDTGITDLTDSNDIKIILASGEAGEAVGNASAEGISGRVWLYNPLSATVYTRANITTAMGSAANRFTWSTGGGQRSATADVDAVQLLFESGNIASGEVRFYGVKDS